jgi:NAD(P)-dependent dehydrogenase (short-subunit alcohol dehydrogenase family)
MEIRLDGDVAIVTGSGRGLGRAYVSDLASRGARVVVNDIAREFADEAVESIRAKGGEAVASYDSVATAAGGQAIVERALDSFGAVDIVVHNAGFLRNGYFEELTPDDVEAVVGVHLLGGFFVGQPAYRVMKERGYGRLVLVSSTSGVFGNVRHANYAAAKTGLVGLANALALEGREHGILTNVVLPKGKTTIWQSNPNAPANTHARHLEQRPVLAGRNDPQTVAPLVTFLSSRLCDVSGQIFSAGYGRFARVFVGVAHGWVGADQMAVAAEDVYDNWDTIQAHGFDGLIPDSMQDELDAAAEAVAAAVGAA